MPPELLLLIRGAQFVARHAEDAAKVASALKSLASGDAPTAEQVAAARRIADGEFGKTQSYLEQIAAENGVKLPTPP